MGKVHRMDANLRVVLVVSDLHCGSTVGLCPPDYATFDGATFGLNRIQRWIWDHWTAMQDDWLPRVIGDDPFALVVNGDATEGIHHKTVQVVHADPGVHAKIAIHCLEPLAAKAAAVYMVRGTEAHVGHTAEANIGARLGSVKHPENGEHSAFAWHLNINGTGCVFRHHIGTSSRLALYATQLSVTLAEEQTAAARHGHSVPKVVVRSHRHTFGHYTDGHASVVTTPAWQALTSFGHKVVPAAVPTVGAVLLDFRNSPPGGLPVVIPYLATIQSPVGATHA